MSMIVIAAAVIVAAFAIAATLVEVVRDGYRRVPTRQA